MLGKNYERKINTMMPLLNEKQKRLYLASESIALGRGGVTKVSRISGISRSVITAGIKDINEGNAEVLSVDAPIRRKGAGRKPITKTQPGITEALEKLVSDSTFGDPMSPLFWTTKSVRRLAEELADKGLKIGYEDAVSHLKSASPDGTFPPMKELKAEKSRLSRQRDQQRAALRPLTEQRKQMRVVAGNVKAILADNALFMDERQQQL